MASSLVEHWALRSYSLCRWLWISRGSVRVNIYCLIHHSHQHQHHLILILWHSIYCWTFIYDSFSSIESLLWTALYSTVQNLSCLFCLQVFWWLQNNKENAEIQLEHQINCHWYNIPSEEYTQYNTIESHYHCDCDSDFLYFENCISNCLLSLESRITDRMRVGFSNNSGFNSRM